MTAVRRMTIKALNGASAALALALAAPAAAQNSDAPIDVTAAPPPTAETVGPSQLRDFSLQGTVTRPADRPATSSGTPPTIAAPPPPRPPAVEGKPATSASVAGDGLPSASSPAASSGAAAATGSAARTATEPNANSPTVSPPVPADVATVPAAQPSYDVAPYSDSPSITTDDSLFSWPWIAALLALVGGGAFIGWSRRGRRQRYGDPGRMAFAGLVPDAEAEPAPTPPIRPRPDPVPPRAQPAPAPQPTPAPAPQPKPVTAPAPASDGLIVSKRLKPELTVQFVPDRAVVSENEVLLQFDVVVANSGSAPARDVLVEARLVCAHAGQDQEIGAFFQNPVAEGDRIAAVAPLGRISLKSAVRMPIDQLHSFEVEGRRLFVPLVAFNVLFRSGSGEGQASASFLVGRGSDEDEKLAPFRLDLGPRIFRGLSARPHSMGLSR